MQFSSCFYVLTVVGKRRVQALVDVAAIVNAADAVVKGIEAIVNLIDGDIHEAEGQFTKGNVSNLRAQYPSMNVLVFHNQASGYDVYGATHAHYEMDIGLVVTQGCEV